jgi:hypothetical protein
MDPDKVNNTIKEFDSLWENAKELDAAEAWRSSKCQR